METLHQLNKSRSLLQSAGSQAFGNLSPAILQCFAIICAGYIAGRTHILSSTHAVGVGKYVSRFALPALLFKSMCELDLHSVNWRFLASVLISKTAVFVVVGLITMLVVRPFNTGKSGLYAIFSTQSNDFALGYPIVQAVYGKSHPELLKYIYLVAPISLVFLNPIGFVLLEVQKWRNSLPCEHGSKWNVLWVVLAGVIKNPVVFMTALGVIGNFVFQEKVPPYFINILTVLADSYSATALFYLGLSMVGKIQGQNGAFLLTPALLIIAKTLLLPFLTREVVNVLDAGGNHNETGDLAMYGFLYGTFPTAPSVFLYSSYYGVATDVIGTGLVACTFISAPLMFVSAQMISMPISSPHTHEKIITDASFDTSILSTICCIWVIGVLFLSRRFRGIPHQFTLCLSFFQCLAAVGLILSHSVTAPWHHYIQFTMLLVGTFASRCFTAVIALMLLAIRCDRLCLALRIKPLMYFYGIGVPVFVVGVLYMIAGSKRVTDQGFVNLYGMPQMLLSLVLLIINIFITVIALVLQQRYTVAPTKEEKEPESVAEPEQAQLTDSSRSFNSSGRMDIPCRKNSLRSVASLGTRVMPYGSGDMLPAPIGSLQGSEIRSESPRVRKKPRRIKAKKKAKKSTDVQCSDCTGEGCTSAAVPTPRSTNIEDLVPFPANMVRNTEADSDNETTRLLPGDPGVGDRTCLLSNSCTVTQREECATLVKSYEQSQMVNGEDAEILRQSRDEYQITRHIVLLILLLISMSVGFFLCVWRLMNEETLGIYVEIEFLDCILNFGQGVFTFGIFGLDTELVIGPLLRRWRKCFYGTEKVHIPDYNKLDPEDKHRCEQFVEHHKENCTEAIVGCKRRRFKTYPCVFTGTDFVDWLIEVGLSNDREDAVDYGRSLLRGQVIEYVTREHHFHDLDYFYRFVENNSIEA